jgi:hemerythrin
MELQFLAWSKEYAVGHTGLDAEHRQLADAINKVCSIECAGCDIDELRPLLEALTIFAVEHFKHENTLLRELDCLATLLQAGRPAIENIISASAINEHCAEHARALLQLESIIHTFDCEAESDRGNLSKMLIGWFTEHALEHDAGLREALQVYLAYSRDASGWG